METRNRIVLGVIVWVLAGLLSGCSTGSSMPRPGGTPVTLSFTGSTPTAVATQTGAGAFTPMTPASQITFTLPPGTTTYAVAYVCPPVTLAGTTQTMEHLVEVSTQDNVQLTLLCLGGGTPPSTGTATGSASSAIAGTASFQIVGKNGLGQGSLASGPFSVTLAAGTNDVALIADDASNLILGIKILRAQTVPGVLNGGSGIILGPADAVVPQSITVNNVPSGFAPFAISAAYVTSNGTAVGLVHSSLPISNPQTYVAVAPADTQAGDFYGYDAIAVNGGTGQSINLIQTTTSGGGPVTLTLPAPWNSSGPAPAKLPMFTFDYTGFTGQPAVADFGSINWTIASAASSIDVMATAHFLNGANTLTLPDLSGLPGFLAPAASGTTIHWSSNIFAGTGEPASLGGTSSNSSLASVGTAGQYTQP